jgi:hypothetical protein
VLTYLRWRLLDAKWRLKELLGMRTRPRDDWFYNRPESLDRRTIEHGLARVIGPDAESFRIVDRGRDLRGRPLIEINALTGDEWRRWRGYSADAVNRLIGMPDNAGEDHFWRTFDDWAHGVNPEDRGELRMALYWSEGWALRLNTREPPQVVSPPEIVGSGDVGSTVTARPAKWESDGVYTTSPPIWRVLDADGQGFHVSREQGGWSKELVVAPEWAGLELRVSYVATNAGGGTEALSHRLRIPRADSANASAGATMGPHDPPRTAEGLADEPPAG